MIKLRSLNINVAAVVGLKKLRDAMKLFDADNDMNIDFRDIIETMSYVIQYIIIIIMRIIIMIIRIGPLPRGRRHVRQRQARGDA